MLRRRISTLIRGNGLCTPAHGIARGYGVFSNCNSGSPQICPEARSGFRQTIKRNSHEVFDSVFSGTDCAGVERVRQADCRDSSGGGYSSRPRARRPDRRHRINRIDRINRQHRSNRIRWGYRLNRIHWKYRRNRIYWKYRRDRFHGGYRGSRSARQNRWRHCGNRSGYASRTLSAP